jgi:hypothetical protein
MNKLVLPLCLALSLVGIACALAQLPSHQPSMIGVGGSAGGGAVGIACDQGPNVAALPISTTLQTAGFTHCALNADFTTSTTDGNGIKYSDTSTWIAECGAPTRTYNFHIAWYLNNTTLGATSSCARATILTDPRGGGFNVLDQAYLNNPDRQTYLADISFNDYRYSDIGLSWPGLSQSSVGLPYEMYVETTIYIPTATLNSRNTAISNPPTPFVAAPNSTTVTSTPPLNSQAHFAVDQFEIIPDYSNSGSTSWQWGSLLLVYGPSSYSSSAGGNLTYYNFTNGYHAFGQLVTSDESSTVSTCTFIDGVDQNNCAVFNVTTAGATACSGGGFACYFGQNSVILRDYLDEETCGTLPLTSTACFVGDLHVYFKSIRVFTCANYKTTQCPGTLITTDNSPLRRFAADGPEMMLRQIMQWAKDKILAIVAPSALAHQ